MQPSSDPATELGLGDLLIAKDAIGGYTLGVFPGPPQLRYRIFADAAAAAAAYAVREQVLIWCTGDGKTFTPFTSAAEAARTLDRTRMLR
jgi:hypothetical protein